MVLLSISTFVGFFAVVASSPINSNSEPSSTCYILEPTVQTWANGGVPMTWLPACWDGFNVQVAPTADQHLMVNSVCNFNVSVQVRQPGRYSANSGALSTSFPGVISPPHNQVFVRLILCPEPNSGSCSPFSDAVKISTDMWASSSEVTVGNNGKISFFQVPAQNDDPDFYFTTPFQKVILTPGVTVNVDVNGTADIYSSSTNELVVGPHYIDQAGNLIIALNFTAESSGESRIFQLFADVFLLYSNFETPNVHAARLAMTNHMATQLTINDPQIVGNSKAFFIVSGIALAILVTIELSLVGAIFYYRQHKVMQLSQYPLLAIMVVAASWATAASFLLFPVNDLRCYLRNSLVFTPLALVGIMMLCRIWRINSILAPAQAIGNKEKETNLCYSLTMDALSILATLNPMECYRTVRVKGKKCSQIDFHLSTFKNERGKLLRRSIPLENVAWLGAMLILPQLILQIVCLANPAIESYFGYDWMMEGLTLDLGKPTCLPKHSWAFYLSITFAILPFVASGFLTYSSQDFPSLFNESASILTTSRFILFVIIIGVPLYLLTNSAAVSADVTAFFIIFLVNVAAFVPSYLITMEKLRIIWSGKNIIVSKLLSSGGNSIALPPTSTRITRNTSMLSPMTTTTDTIQLPPMATLPPMDSNVEELDLPERITTEISVRMYKPLPAQVENSVLYMKNYLVQFMKDSMSGMQIQKEELERLKEKGILFGEMCGRIVIISESEGEGAAPSG